VTHRAAWGPGGGAGGAPADLYQGVAAARVAVEQVRAVGGGFGCRQRPEDRFQDFFAFGVQPWPVLGHLLVVKGLGEADTAFALVLAALELPFVAVGCDRPVPQPPDLFGSVVGGDLDEPGPDRLHRLFA